MNAESVCPLTVAPHFAVVADVPGRVLVRGGDGWREPTEAERAALLPGLLTPAEAARCLCLFDVPAHLRSQLWQVLAGEIGPALAARFQAFATDLMSFLEFKQLSAPPGAVFDLLFVRGTMDALEMPWALINLGDVPAALTFADVRLRLAPGEGCLVQDGCPPPGACPPETSEPAVVLLIRRPPQPEGEKR